MQRESEHQTEVNDLKFQLQKIPNLLNLLYKKIVILNIKKTTLDDQKNTVFSIWTIKKY